MFEYDTRVSAKICRFFATRLRMPTLCIVSDMETPDQPAEARLIDDAQKSAIPALSMRKAADIAGISDGRWRQIVKGYQGTGTGRIPVVAPDETLARMALAVGVTAPQLAEAGRPGAAEVLQRLLAASELPDVELERVPTDRLLGEIRRRIEGADHAVPTDSSSPARASREEGPPEKNNVRALIPQDQGSDDADDLPPIELPGAARNEPGYITTGKRDDEKDK